MNRKNDRFLDKIDQYPSLEQILWAMNGMRKCQVFTKNPKYDQYGFIKNPFTPKGAKLYDRLSDFLHGVSNLAGSSEAPYSFVASCVMDALDEISIRNG